ncbi:MAG: GlsB/YeaQ/YmgE family stress response membrane protein [Planctomycetales bacterium]|nr:GlsB/YeaQ/YmgE family stress response membrane protein [Planctomycetales bacterium]
MLTAIIGWIVFGLIVGAIARLLVPGRQPLGLAKTMALGVVGSFLGGFVGYLLAGGSPLQASGWIGSVIGAVVVLAFATRRDPATLVDAR